MFEMRRGNAEKFEKPKFKKKVTLQSNENLNTMPGLLCQFVNAHLQLTRFYVWNMPKMKLLFFPLKIAAIFISGCTYITAINNSIIYWNSHEKKIIRAYHQMPIENNQHRNFSHYIIKFAVFYAENMLIFCLVSTYR